MTKEDDEIIKSYLLANEDDIFVSIGRILQSNPTDSEGAIAGAKRYKNALMDGKKYFNKMQNEWKRKICKEAQIIAKIENNKIDNDVELVLIIADIITTKVFPIPVFTVAALIVKKGLYAFCKT